MNRNVITAKRSDPVGFSNHGAMSISFSSPYTNTTRPRFSELSSWATRSDVHYEDTRCQNRRAGGLNASRLKACSFIAAWTVT
jgi:hypothetical protein